jgi:hypothetical protein
MLINATIVNKGGCTIGSEVLSPHWICFQEVGTLLGCECHVPYQVISNWIASLVSYRHMLDLSTGDI